MIITRRNYKVIAQVEIPGTAGTQLLTIFDIGAGPNFIRKAVMPPELAQITEHGAFPNICDANGNPIRMKGRARLHVALGTYRLTLEFIVCDSLAVPCLMGADFCDQFVLAIRPKERLVELDDGSTIPIVRNPNSPIQPTL